MYYLYAFIAISLYAILPPIAKKVAIAESLPPMMFIAFTMLVLSLSAFLGSILFEKSSISTVSGIQWLWIVGFGLINLIAFILFVVAIKYIPIADYQIIGLLMPIIGGTIAYFWFGEKLESHFFIGFVLMSIGLIIALGKFTFNG